MSAQLWIAGVRRWGEDGATPVVLDDRHSCGSVSDHIARGCIGIEVSTARNGGMRGPLLAVTGADH